MGFEACSKHHCIKDLSRIKHFILKLDDDKLFKFYKMERKECVLVHTIFMGLFKTLVDDGALKRVPSSTV